MKLWKKTEKILRFVTVLIALAIAIFSPVYEYRQMGRYAQSLPNAERAAFAIAGILIYVLAMLPAAFLALALGVWLLSATTKLGTAEGYSKKRLYVRLIVLRFCLVVVYAYLCAMDIAMCKTPCFGTFVYVFGCLVFAFSAILSICLKRNLTEETETTKELEK